MRSATRPLALGLLSLLSGCSASDRARLGDDALSDTRDPGYSARDAEVLETGPDGALRYRLSAQRIEQDPNSLDIRLTSLDMQVASAERDPWRVSAQSGVLPSQSARVSLSGTVTIEGGAQTATGPIRIQTDQLDYDLRSELARAEGPVSIEMQGYRLDGRGLEADLRNQRARLLADIQGHAAR